MTSDPRFTHTIELAAALEHADSHHPLRTFPAPSKNSALVTPELRYEAYEFQLIVSFCWKPEPVAELWLFVSVIGT